jgi:hypothetical protein
MHLLAKPGLVLRLLAWSPWPTVGHYRNPVTPG